MDAHEECCRRAEELRRSLEAAQRVNQELVLAMGELEQAVGTDRLTGAWNRRRFEEAAAVEISLARRRKGPVSLLLLDLDHFKGVNDEFGHAAGDAVLSQTAQVVRQNLRVSDALVRWGGEEFIVLAPATRLDGAMSLAEKIREAVASHAFPIDRAVTVSIGGAEFLPGMDMDGWIRCADEALYRAKAEGRNRVMAGEGQSATEEVPSILEIVWDEAYACGEPIIDAQHQRLFALANALFGATTSGQPSAEISLRLRKLSAHAAQHFQDEEMLLRNVGYANFSQHAHAHQELLNQMHRLQQECEQGRVELARLVDFFIMDVVQGHLLAEDRMFFGCFQGSGSN
jgi:diguanylate cyclase (GGDEF)-like protein/hemerythrin-like metal-binding protein